MQYDNKHLLNFGVVIGVEWLKFGEKFGENHNIEDQNCNNGVLEILMVLLCFYNRIPRELTHVEIIHVPNMTWLYIYVS